VQGVCASGGVGMRCALGLARAPCRTQRLLLRRGVDPAPAVAEVQLDLADKLRRAASAVLNARAGGQRRAD
ncbi:hypothetical protein NL529_33690, partial [Klebsiella pneumoniae]|nr:hypothetical protein [Klebsiella pneumoniae]